MGRKREQVVRNAAQARVDETSTTDTIVFTAAGAIGAALLGAALTRKGWEPRYVSGAITVVGWLLAHLGDSEVLRALGAGAMGGSGAQLVLLLFAEEARETPVVQRDAANVNTTQRLGRVVAS